MPYREKEIEKKYYSISEVADLFNVASSLIRFWEKEFDIIKPRKNKKGNRQFTQKDIENVKFVYHLVKERGLTLDGAKKVIRDQGEEVQDKQEMIDSLKAIRDFLYDLKNQLS